MSSAQASAPIELEAARPAKRKSPAAARRAALAEAHAEQIAEHMAHFGESFDKALGRVVAEQDELDRLMADILAVAA